jgi:hypothetical protein
MKEITSLGVSPSPEACGITVDDGLAGRRARMATNFPLPVQSVRTTLCPPSPRHARKHAVLPYQRVKERGPDMEKDGREEQKCENRVGAAQEGIKLVIVRHNLRQMDWSPENDRIATSRKYRPTDQGHGNQQGVEKVAGSLKR